MLALAAFILAGIAAVIGMAALWIALDAQHAATQPAWKRRRTP